MKRIRALGIAVLVAAVGVSSALGATAYVWGTSPSEAAPYDTWDKAAHSLQVAVAYANTNTGIDVVLATNGTYTVTSRINVTNAIAIRSVNGPLVTTASGSGVATVFFLSNTVAQVAGFTVRGGNGGSSEATLGGGGVLCMFASALVSNCILTANFATHYGGAVWGGAVVACVITNNNATRLGGGLHSSAARNCLIVGNVGGGEGGGGGMYGGSAMNCTIVSNKAWRSDTGLQNGGGVLNTLVTNSIVRFNIGATGNEDWFGGSMAYSDSLPLPAGPGNSNQDPNFVDWRNGNFRLNPGPCIDTGTNLAWMTGGTDLEGANRVINSRVDMGCYESDLANGPLTCSFSGTPTLGFDQVQTVFTAAVAGSNTTITTYAWDFGAGQTPQAGPGLVVVTNTYASVGGYTVTLRVTNAPGESASLTYSDYVTVVPRTVYVSTNGSNTYPYDTWGKAANSISAAILAAQVIGTNRSTVLVSNGTYNVIAPIVVSKGIIVRSVNGPLATRVARIAGSRVFDLQDPGATLSGLMIRDGNVTDGSYNNAGGGVYSAFSSALVTNCHIVCNFATHYGGGASGGTLVNCVITNNTGTRSGGGLSSSSARNCLIAFNTGGEGGTSGGGGGIDVSTAENCTIVSNTAWRSDGYGSGGGARNSTLVNCIVYPNRGASAAVDNWFGGSVSYSCTTPLPGGAGNTDLDPQFVDFAARNYRLRGLSPCVNAGTNLAWVAGALDLDGSARVQQSRVDMGAWEYIPPSGTAVLIR
jgi:hypothetical protein